MRRFYPVDTVEYLIAGFHSRDQQPCFSKKKEAFA